MRHRWDGKLGKHNKKGYVSCIKCGCSKQRYYGSTLYFVDYLKDPFMTAPDCNMVKHFGTYPNMEIDNVAKLLS